MCIIAPTSSLHGGWVSEMIVIRKLKNRRNCSILTPTTYLQHIYNTPKPHLTLTNPSHTTSLTTPPKTPLNAVIPTFSALSTITPIQHTPLTHPFNKDNKDAYTGGYTLRKHPLPISVTPPYRIRLK